MNNIKKLRKAHGLTQVELSKKLGVTQGNLSAWETGRWQPDMDSLRKLCEILDCSADYLLGRDVPPATETEKRVSGIYLSLAKELEDMELSEEDIRQLAGIAKYLKSKNDKIK